MTSTTVRGGILDMDADDFPDWYELVADDSSYWPRKFGASDPHRRPAASHQLGPDPVPGPAGALYLTTEQAATYLNVKPRFIRRLVEDGRVTVTKVGRFNRFTRADLDAVVDRRHGAVLPTRRLRVIDPTDPIAALMDESLRSDTNQTEQSNEEDK